MNDGHVSPEELTRAVGVLRDARLAGEEMLEAFYGRKGVIVPGVGKDAPVAADPVTGAKQSEASYRCDLLPPLATIRVAQVLSIGAAKYGDWNWFPIPYKDDLNHALIHIFAFLAGDVSDDHMGHAACRMMMALERFLMDQLAKKETAITPHQILDTGD